MAKKHPGFGGGVFMFNNPAQDQAYNISNMILDPDGRAYKRQGFCFQSRIPPLGAQILSLFRWYRIGSPPQLLAHGSDGHLYYTTDLINWVDGGSGLSTTEPASFAVGYSAGSAPVVALNAPAVYIADGTTIFRWSGSALVNISGAGGSSAPVARYVVWWKDTLFLLTGRGSTDPEHVYSSAAANADSWPALNHVAIGKGDGDYGTALFTASQELIVSKQKRTFVIVSPTTYENRVVDYEKGCECHWSVVKFDADIFYLTRYGIARFVSGAPAEIVSTNIQPLFSTLFQNMSQLHKCHGYRVHHRIGWTLVRQGKNYPDFQIEYYPQFPRRPWTFHQMPALCFETVRDTQERLFFGRSDLQGLPNPGLFEAFCLTQVDDDGTQFKGIIETPWDDLGDPINRKYLRAIRLWGDGEIFVQVKRDRREAAGQLMVAELVPDDPKWNETPTDKWSLSDVWGTFGSVGTDIVYPDLYGRQFSVVLFDNPNASTPDLPPARRPVGDLTYIHPRGWSILELTLELVQMGELG
jgi:hypothetical protein